MSKKDIWFIFFLLSRKTTIKISRTNPVINKFVAE